MDDLLETPSSLPPTVSSGLPHEEEQQSEEEEGGLDWTKLLRSSARPVIPKRGEKEYEPRAAGGTNLQIHVLDQSRNAMFETLRTTRSISSKAVSYAIWHPGIARTEVTVARGIHFANMGHSAPRSISGEDGIMKAHKRLELLPEEAIYLIERGALFCWKATNLALSQIPGLNDVLGSPMSLQQAYSEMMGTEGITLEKFQVFSYLKRLGYVVTRANPPDSYYPTPPKASKTIRNPSIMDRIKSLYASWKSIFYRVFFGEFNWWKPLRISRWLYHDKNYTSIFNSLRFIPAGHDAKVIPPNRTPMIDSPYQIFYHIYKPSTPFKKSSPPPPDFHVVVVNARTTPMPTLQELTNLFAVLPRVPVPPPRPRRSPQPQGSSSINGTQLVSEVTSSPCPVPSSPRSRLWVFFQKLFHSKADPSSPRPNKPNPFVALKTGKRSIIIAAVDMGSISFFKFGQGEFSEWPMA